MRTAEQTVADAWIGQLLLAENEAEVAVGACTRVRNRAAEQVRAAQRSGDLDALVRSQCALERADRACGRALEEYVQARTRLCEQLNEWACATRRRTRQAQADHSSAGRR
ncbi:MAG: hypothetical protein ACJ786_23595 [Catenulispora sp.]